MEGGGGSGGDGSELLGEDSTTDLYPLSKYSVNSILFLLVLSSLSGIFLITWLLF